VAVALGRKRKRASPRDAFAKLVKEREASARAAKPQAPTEETVKAQVEAFLALSPEEVDPLEWWKVHERKYRFLAPLAKKYLAQPGSVADVERLWSRAKWIENAHGPTAHESKALTQLLSLGDNAKGLGMLAKTHRGRGGAGAAIAGTNGAEVGAEIGAEIGAGAAEQAPDSLPLQKKRMAGGAAASSNDVEMLDGLAALADEDDL